MIERLRRPPSLGATVGAVVAFVSLLVGLGPLNDNSFFTHLATGRIMVATHHIPHSDVYSFTAPGHSWVVQSWLASLVYGLAEKWWGGGGTIVVVGLTASLVGTLVWRLTRPAVSLIARLLVLIPVFVVGVDAGWVERPLLFGLVCLGVTLLAAEGRVDPRWLVPVFWVWVNTHGSFPLGLVAIGLFAVGRRFDHEDASVEWRALRWALVGALAGGVLNPLGPRLLVFPIELLRRQDVLSNVLEWQAPKFTSLGQRAFLVELVLGIVVLARRPSWRAALPLAAFTLASLIGARNVVVASIVFVPGIAGAMPRLGSISGDDRRSIFRPVIATVVALAVLTALLTATSDHVYNFNGYPVAAVTWAERNGVLTPDSRVVSRDYVGNYLEVRDGARYKVFLDDRFDMYPSAVIDDFALLNAGRAGWEEVLERNHATAVLWPTDESLAQLLAASPRWRVVYSDQEFLIALPR